MQQYAVQEGSGPVFDALQLLPLELWLLLAEHSPTIWRLLSQAVPCLGRYSLNADVQSRLMDRWVNSDGFLPNGARHGFHMSPASLCFGALESNIRESFYRNDKFHRDRDLPAVTHYRTTNGTICSMRWYWNGLLHRDGDQPAEKSYRADGTLECEKWYWNGEQRRAQRSLPTINWYYSNGSIQSQQWER